MNTATAQRAYMLAGVMAALATTLRLDTMVPGDGGELKAYQGAMQAAIDASDAIDDLIDIEAVNGVYVYELHDEGEAITKLYQDLAQLAATDQVTSTATREAVSAFLDCRSDFTAAKPTVDDLEVGQIQVSLDGGVKYMDAPSGVRIAQRVITSDGDAAEIQTTHSSEGTITDLWAGDVHLGTRAEQLDDLMAALDGDATPPRQPMPQGRGYELQLRGFDGSTDETDDRVVWVTTDLNMAAVAQLLRDAGLYSGADRAVVSLRDLPIQVARAEAEFELPRDMAALAQHVNGLVGQPA